MSTFNHKLYLVTDEAACKGRPLVQVVEQAVRGGVDLVQIREKTIPDQDFIRKALHLQDMLARYQVPLIVNDRLAVAMACHAHGIHVGNQDASPLAIKGTWAQCRMIGYSLEAEEQLLAPRSLEATYLALSPVFATHTKTDTITEWGLEGVRRIRSLTTRPLVAIGNVHRGNAGPLIRAGADCLAIVSAICSADDPAAAATAIREEIEKNS